MSTVLDLHVHSAFSIDSPVEPEKYLERLVELRRDYSIDGLAFCEHRRFRPDFDGQAQSKKYGAVVLQGVEAETRWGHILVFCPDLSWYGRLDLSVKLDPLELAEQTESHQGILIPSHPFRGMISLRENVKRIPHLQALETLNGSNLPEENDLAATWASELGLAQTGGSDAHFLNEFGRALSVFEDRVSTVEDMINAIRSRRVRPALINDVRI
jgi:predicted metal-dependent phosphoesterase TrpH